MRLSSDGRRLIYVAGLGQRPPAPMVTVILEDGRRVPIAPGHSPRWSSGDAVLFCPQEDGLVQWAASPSWQADDTETLAGNTLATGGGLHAVHRTDPRRVLTSADRLIPNAMDPAISDDGRWLAYVLADTDEQGNPRPGVSTLFVDRSDGSQARRALWEGAPARPQFGGTTLAWEIGRGLIAACADVSNPAVPATAFALPSAWKLSRPVPVWVPTRGELWVLFVADAGTHGAIYLATWTSLRLGEPKGYQLGASTGSAYDHDARPNGLDHVSVQWLDPHGLPDGVTKKLTEPRVVLAPPVAPEPEPEPLPDVPFTVDPHGVIEDIATWLWSPNQGPDVHFSPDGSVRMFVKSDERSGDGPDPEIAEHWDKSDDPADFNIGHLEDASTGRRIFEGREVVAEDIVALFPHDHARVWAGLKLNRNTFAAGKRLWMPRRLVSGTSIRYVTDISWTVPPRQTPHTRVWRNVAIEIRIDVGHGRIHGREVRARVAYIPGGNPEWNFFGPPNGFNAWVAHHAGKVDPWSAK